MSKVIKILALGLSQSNFLGQLYGDLKKSYKNYKIGVNEFYDLSKGKIEIEEKIFSAFFNFKNEKVSRLESDRSFINFSFTPLFWEIYFFERSQGKSRKETYHFLRRMAYDKVIVEKYVLKSNYDIYHFHYCSPKNLNYLHFFPKEKKVVCSFWGSDLMRETGVRNIFYVSKALEKASSITIQNKELAEMLYCKYGRELKDKTNIVQFTISTQIYNFIDLFRNNPEEIQNFKIKYGIPLDKKIITVSHNAFVANNHIDILKTMDDLPVDVKSRFAFVLPLGYGRNEEYLSKLEQFKISSSNKIFLLHQFFGPEETALLRLSTDIMVQMPVSDAMSGAMTEILYAGKQVITGSWLPYGLLRRNGVQFIEVDEFGQLPEIVENYCNNEDNFKKNNLKNAEKIKAFLFPDSTTPAWNKIFDKL